MLSYKPRNIVLCLIVSSIAIVATLYYLYGHNIIRASYEGNSIDLLNKAIATDDLYPLSYYLTKADRLVLGVLIFLGMWIPPLFLEDQKMATVYAAFSRISDFLLRHKRLLLIGGTIISLSTLLFNAIFILQSFPNSADEYCYLYQSQTFSAGRFWNIPHPLQHFFDYCWIIHDDGKLFSMYWPGWPLVLSLARFFGLPDVLVNPILGTLTLLVLYKVGQKLFDEKIALLATITLFLSSFFLFNSASYFSHSLCALLVLLFVYFCIRTVEERRAGLALLAGVFFGFAFITRPYTALLCGIPPLMFCIYQLRKHPVLLVNIVAGGLPFLLFLFVYNNNITGNPLLPPITVGLRDSQNWSISIKNLTNSIKLFIFFVLWSPPFVILTYLILLPHIFKGSKTFLTGSIFLLLVSGHFFFTFAGGNQYGPRYYYEGYPLLILFITFLLFRENSYFEKSNLSKFVFVLFFMSLIYHVPLTIMHITNEKESIWHRMEPYRLVEQEKIKDAVVFLKSGSGTLLKPMPVEDLTRNDPDYANSVLFAKDQGVDNLSLMNHYPERNYYYYFRDRNNSRGYLQELKRSDLDRQLVGENVDLL
jgi:hypothetical protein